ncbi:MAG: shikimate kinase [Planctomycetota bacterium]|nr:shikimate kinase [Planctomycetota bacterium]MDI6787239.1 shikimate kinase [Planctomycetota bacterium]
MNIILIGFRGTGKTSVGQILAREIKWSFIDADEYIERRYGFMIAELFEKHGESLFRLLESDAIHELSRLDSHVIAAGGGAVLKYKNVKNLKKNGLVFRLESDCDVIYHRILKDDEAGKSRPRLTTKNLYDEIKSLMEFREPYYKQASDYTINTSKSTPQQVVNNICEILRTKGLIPY